MEEESLIIQSSQNPLFMIYNIFMKSIPRVSRWTWHAMVREKKLWVVWWSKCPLLAPILLEGPSSTTLGYQKKLKPEDQNFHQKIQWFVHPSPPAFPQYECRRCNGLVFYLSPAFSSWERKIFNGLFTYLQLVCMLYHTREEEPMVCFRIPSISSV